MNGCGRGRPYISERMREAHIEFFIRKGCAGLGNEYRVSPEQAYRAMQFGEFSRREEVAVRWALDGMRAEEFGSLHSVGRLTIDELARMVRILYPLAGALAHLAQPVGAGPGPCDADGREPCLGARGARRARRLRPARGGARRRAAYRRGRDHVRKAERDRLLHQDGPIGGRRVSEGGRHHGVPAPHRRGSTRPQS